MAGTVIARDRTRPSGYDGFVERPDHAIDISQDRLGHELSRLRTARPDAPLSELIEELAGALGRPADGLDPRPWLGLRALD